MTRCSYSKADLWLVVGKTRVAPMKLNHPQAGITSSPLSRSVNRRNRISVNNTCRANLYMDRQHYLTSVVAVHRRKTRLFSQSGGKNSRVDGKKQVEIVNDQVNGSLTEIFASLLDLIKTASRTAAVNKATSQSKQPG